MPATMLHTAAASSFGTVPLRAMLVTCAISAWGLLASAWRMPMLREPVELLDRLGDDADQLKFSRRRINAVQLHDPIWKIELGVAAAHTRHITIDNRAELLAGFGLELMRRFAIISDEFAGEHALTAEGVLMAPRDRQQINERVKIPESVLDRRRREHEHVPKAPLFESLLKSQRHLRRRIDAVKVAQLMRLIEDQHLEAVFGN